MNKKTQVAILIATLTMQSQSMNDIQPKTVMFDGFKTANSFFTFKQIAKCKKNRTKNEYRIGKIYLKNNIPANSVVDLIIPARTTDGRKVVFDKASCAGWDDKNIKINLHFVTTERLKIRKYKVKNEVKVHCQKIVDYVKIVGDKSDFFKGSSSLWHLNMSGIDKNPAKYSKGGKKKNKNVMTSMFDGCTGLESIQWGNFNTRNVTRMDYAFRDCRNLKNLNLKHLNTSDVGTMRGMFANCYALEDLKIRVSSTSQVQNMEKMFMNCISLKSVDLRNFDMQSVQTAEEMFAGCELIQFIKFPTSNAPRLTNMRSMFENCRSLDTLDLRQVNIPSSAIMTGFISGCRVLDTVSFHPDMEEKKCTNELALCRDCPRFIFEKELGINQYKGTI